MRANQKIIKSIDIVFMKDSMSIGNDLEMCPSGRNEAPMVNAVNGSSKSPLDNFDEEHEEQVEENHIANQEAREGPTNNDIGVYVERLGKE